MTNVPSGTNKENMNREYRKQLRSIARQDCGNPPDQIQQILQLGVERYDVTLGLLVQVDPVGEVYTIDEVSTSHPDLTRGLTGDLLSTYCRLVVAEQEPLAVMNAPEQGWRNDPAYQSTLLSTYIGTEVHVGGNPYGTVCFVDRDPKAVEFDEQDRTVLDLIAQVTEQVLARREAEKSPPVEDVPQDISGIERRYRTALQHSPVTFAKIDEELRYEWVRNPPSEIDPADMIGKRDDELDTGPGIDRLMNLKRRTFDTGEQIREEIVFEGTDEFTVHDVTATPLREGAGTEVTAIITASLDITDHKHRERKLEESEARYRALAENFPGGAVGVYDQDLRYTLVKGTLVGKVFPEAEVMKGSRVPDLFPEATVRDIEPLFRAAVADGETGSVETEFKGRNWRVTATPLRDNDGVIFAGLSFAQDITDQKRREMELRRQRNLLDQAQRLAGAWEINLRTNDLVWSKTVYDIHEVSPDTDLTLDDAYDFFPPDAREEMQAAVDQCIEQKRPYDLELPLITANGNQRWIRAVGAPSEMEGDRVVKLAGAFQDITERKEAERELQQSEQRFRKIFENAAVGIVIVDGAGCLLRANPAFQAMIGDDEEALQGQPFSALTHSDDVESDWDLLDDLIHGAQDRCQLDKRFVRNDGSIFWGRLTASLLSEEGRYVALVEDIDDQKQYEAKLREAKEEAEKAVRLKSVMLANMSHEVRTPLTSMIGFSGILEEQLSGRLAKLARLIHKSGRRLEETLESVLQFSQLEADSYQIDRRALPLDELVWSVVEEFEPQSRERGVPIHVESAAAPVEAYADEVAVRQVISNLLDNALKFSPEGKEVTVRVMRDDANGSAVLEVEDTGVGIGEEALPYIFEAFQQESEGLTREYEGAGLGLSIVEKLVDALGGQIEVTTQKGEGTRFVVYLPRPEGSGA